MDKASPEKNGSESKTFHNRGPPPHSQDIQLYMIDLFFTIESQDSNRYTTLYKWSQIHTYNYIYICLLCPKNQVRYPQIWCFKTKCPQWTPGFTVKRLQVQELGEAAPCVTNGHQGSCSPGSFGLTDWAVWILQSIPTVSGVWSCLELLGLQIQIPRQLCYLT